MNEAAHLVLAVLAGVLLGTFFFAGLWWTVKRSMVSPQPALLILGSFLVRTAIAVGGFYLAVQGGWQGLLACMGGFLVARVLLTRFIGAQHPEPARQTPRLSP
ncbi:ATP synthase subunit I [Rhodanobacter sp. AS-Z3]|uniref:ATP synthase subunit I n=1 Tax=Rhodanobacter sp. AS-Z3 TaxID=3031330 RepID=UPI00247A83B5|nr:ATP synthase subunit I [Rhodanobacter sp. AS-Z3]WEN16572.1 ATP synthase subunit I [Rhodanobacter sp. AS-Z3]